MKTKYKVVVRDIKYPRLELKTGKLVVIVPRDGDLYVPEFIDKHKDWIKDKQNLIKKYSQQKVSARKHMLTEDDLRTAIFKFIKKNESLLGTKPKRVIIKNMKTKWGSCSSSKNLCFNLLLSKLPDTIIEYVVFHEMCHLKNRKHDDNFKSLLNKKYSNPGKFELKLFVYWFHLNKENS